MNPHLQDAAGSGGEGRQFVTPRAAFPTSKSSRFASGHCMNQISIFIIIKCSEENPFPSAFLQRTDPEIKHCAMPSEWALYVFY